MKPAVSRQLRSSTASGSPGASRPTGASISTEAGKPPIGTNTETRQNAETPPRPDADARPRRDAAADTAPAPSDPGEIPIDRPAPDFVLSDLRGAAVDSSYTSRPVTMVHFWATWCVPCMAEIPEMNRIAATYEPAGAAVFAVALSSGTAGELRQVERVYNIRHTVLMGDAAIARGFGGVESFPITFLVDNRGRIVEKHMGASREVRKRMERTMRAMLVAAGRKIAPEK